ncbi:FAD-dependent oxidoreductase [Luteolibacter sp. SL250]|uniref:UDP-galactopyranose/dTDP-fucopyranose mutase family protein n=1 Tax=Luteolibacter sp. SL250 TaxID=2995170 RepID=UPI00226E7527|nr:FAD-dependent oxidoreductase [Luteolibacter sp. SL250]WAC20461.1 FAD-dependent oxidoreductase [Luteolibacter sp. SL250]
MQSDFSTDFLIIGAGFSGLVVAERLAAAGWKCVVVDRRPHLAGNAFDSQDEAGVLTHRYGPHYFRTNSRRILDYLSRFTGWHEVAYTIKSFTRGRYWSFPVNLNTFEELTGKSSTSEEFAEWLAANRVPISSPANSEEVILSQAGPDFYKLFFEGYTLKQWKRHPRDLDASVCGRIPIRTNRDDRYLTESFQALPDKGYTAMFGSLLAASPRVEVHLGVDSEEARRRWKHRHLIYTGAIDEYFGYQFGPLPYRSLRFEHEAFSAGKLREREEISGKPGFWQPAMQVNYPDADVPFTRIIEIKHATGQKTPASSIIREYPKDWTPGTDPYYPVPAPDSRAAYLRYAELASTEKNTSFIGRLATYRYYNMDQVTGMALAEADRLLTRYGTP